jgi:hypothetical protein
MDFHTDQLSEHCRVCGKRLSKAKGRATVYNCIKYKSELLTYFGVDVSQDVEEKHPPSFCNPCYAATKRADKAAGDGVPYNHTIIPINWTEHSASGECLVRPNL